MLCIKCGAELTGQDLCPDCGADVKMFNRLVRISNMYYNSGLDKAKVRDLSGAIQDLKYSLEVNKENIQARNLLGLIYFEIGEVVDALTEWIISKNLEPQKNIADEYIRAIQANQARLETINQTVKKYNQSLLYCQQGSEDLAIIQLKKVLSLNSRLVKAHRLLGLLYIKTENYERAGREFKRALAIDRTDTMSLHYQQELNEILESAGNKKEEPKDVISYTSGNETIIMPATYKDNSGANVIVNIIIGLVVGVALMWFLVIPAKIHSARSDANQQIVEYSDQLSARQATIDSLTQELANVKAQMAQLEEEPEEEEETGGAADQLMEAAAAYNASDREGAKNLLAELDTSTLSEPAMALYRQIDIALNPEAYQEAYQAGNQAYQAKNYAEAIAQLEPIVLADASYENGYALYYLARSCESSGEIEKAIAYFGQFEQMLPGTERANYSRNAVKRLEAQLGQQAGTEGQQAGGAEGQQPGGTEGQEQ